MTRAEAARLKKTGDIAREIEHGISQGSLGPSVAYDTALIAGLERAVKIIDRFANNRDVPSIEHGVLSEAEKLIRAEITRIRKGAKGK